MSGKLGSGKDYIAEHYILPLIHGNVSKMAFADQIKITVASRDSTVTLSQCLHGVKNAELRKKLQIVGTEEGRDKYGPDIWINTLENWIQLRRLRDGNPDVVLITDCRFPNEAKWIERNGGLLIRIIAPTRNELALSRESNGNSEVYNSIATHQSETALDEYHFEYIVNNDPEHVVTDQVSSIFQQYIETHPNKSRFFGTEFLTST